MLMIAFSCSLHHAVPRAKVFRCRSANERAHERRRACVFPKRRRRKNEAAVLDRPPETGRRLSPSAAPALSPCSFSLSDDPRSSHHLTGHGAILVVLARDILRHRDAPPKGEARKKKTMEKESGVFSGKAKKSEHFSLVLGEKTREGKQLSGREESDGGVPTRPPAAPRRGRGLREHGRLRKQAWLGGGESETTSASVKASDRSIDLIQHVCLSSIFVLFRSFDATGICISD